jgi:molybdopterin synthase catalytic subunit
VAEVALPSPRARVLDRPLSVDEAIAVVKHAGAGAVVVMLGIVRDHTARGAATVGVTRLEYEAYAAMAEKVMGAILDEAASRWPGVRAAVDHRTGDLAVGDTAVVVAVSAPHRAEAFSACAFVIDRLKEDAPIWKREHGDDGTTWVGLGP